MARSNRHIHHGRLRRWWAPWTVICRCGIGAYPCPAMRMRQLQAGALAQPTTSASWSDLKTVELASRRFNGGSW